VLLSAFYPFAFNLLATGHSIPEQSDKLSMVQTDYYCTRYAVFFATEKKEKESLRIFYEKSGHGFPCPDVRWQM
jgi:hypothetical protein